MNDPDPVAGAPAIWTVGHSTLSLEAFLDLLKAHAIEHVADVRSFPGSRRHPHFSAAALTAELARARIGYSHHRDLGGFRKPRPDSPHRGWRDPSFRGYADHMSTPAFGAALDELMARARGLRVTLLCAEADPWRCHRRLISDALVARGWAVVHIRETRRVEPHRLVPPARLEAGVLHYPGGDLFAAGAGEE